MKPARVIISVRRGIAETVRIPRGVVVEIRDYDSQEAGGSVGENMNFPDGSQRLEYALAGTNHTVRPLYRRKGGAR